MASPPFTKLPVLTDPSPSFLLRFGASLSIGWWDNTCVRTQSNKRPADTCHSSVCARAPRRSSSTGGRLRSLGCRCSCSLFSQSHPRAEGPRLTTLPLNDTALISKIARPAIALRGAMAGASSEQARLGHPSVFLDASSLFLKPRSPP